MLIRQKKKKRKGQRKICSLFAVCICIYSPQWKPTTYVVWGKMRLSKSP